MSTLPKKMDDMTEDDWRAWYAGILAGKPEPDCTVGDASVLIPPATFTGYCSNCAAFQARAERAEAELEDLRKHHTFLQKCYHHACDFYTPAEVVEAVTKAKRANAAEAEVKRLNHELACADYVHDMRTKEMRAGVKRLREAIAEALMHLETNYDIDGQSMKDSDAANALRRALCSNSVSADKPT